MNQENKTPEPRPTANSNVQFGNKFVPKVAPKIEPKTEPVQAGETVNQFMVTSEIDAAILDRQKSMPKSLGEVDSIVVTKPVDGRHQLSLPAELEEFKKKYAFCWIFKRKQAIDEAIDQYHWVFVNRSYFPDLPGHLFSARGVIERGDEILMFRSAAVDAEMRKTPGIESTQRLKNRTEAHLNDPKFYIPTEESETVTFPDGKTMKLPVVGV